MSTQLKLRKGTTAQHATFTGAEAEVTVDTSKDTLVVHDGVTAGGFPLAKASDIATGLKTADIGVTVQGYDAQLADVAGLTPTDNGVIIGNGTNFVVESGATLKTSLGLTIGTDVQAYDANTAKTNAVQSFTVAQRGAITALTDGASIATDLALANNFSLTIAGNRTLANPTNIVAGQSGVIVITQDATGSRTLAYGSYWKFVGGTAPSLTTAASAVDVLVYYVESSTRITARLISDVK
jgi:hypothetical protein